MNWESLDYWKFEWPFVILKSGIGTLKKNVLRNPSMIQCITKNFTVKVWLFFMFLEECFVVKRLNWPTVKTGKLTLVLNHDATVTWSYEGERSLNMYVASLIQNLLNVTILLESQTVVIVLMKRTLRIGDIRPRAQIRSFEVSSGPSTVWKSYCKHWIALTVMVSINQWVSTLSCSKHDRITRAKTLGLLLRKSIYTFTNQLNVQDMWNSEIYFCCGHSKNWFWNMFKSS